VPANLAAFEELEVLVRALGEELARFRKRALSAEARLKQLQESDGGGDLFSADRLATVEAENRDLRERVDEAATRTRAVMERVRFLRQQAQANGE
jgi:hypothetical protein